MIHLALAFTMAHPAVTAPIIGPRTMEQLESQLGAAELTLPGDVLDRIDEIVPPGTTISDADRGYVPPALRQRELRRRVSGMSPAAEQPAPPRASLRPREHLLRADSRLIRRL